MNQLVRGHYYSMFRVGVECLVLLAIAKTMVETWFVDGLWDAYRISGGSMADSLCGERFAARCKDCGHPFSYDATRGKVHQTVCPNCGHYDIDEKSGRYLDGERVFIDRWSLELRQPARWELVAFHHPKQADQLLVKRLIGLPGETVDIRHGDVYIHDTIQRKNLAQQHAMALLVHDANCQTTLEPVPPCRWRGDDGTLWNSRRGRFSHPASDLSQPMDWLIYHHEHRKPGNPGEVEESPITDLYGYNQSTSRRWEDIHPVADILLSARLTEVTGKGTLVFRATDGVEILETRLFFSGNRPHYEIFRADQPVSDGAGAISLEKKGTILEISLIDQQYLLAINGRTIFTLPLERIEPAHPPATPLAIGVRGLGVIFRDLRVYRDIYYTRPLGVESSWGLDKPVKLGSDEYYVLGDNSPISEDSRAWSKDYALVGNLLIGRPFFWPFSRGVFSSSGSSENAIYLVDQGVE